MEDFIEDEPLWHMGISPLLNAQMNYMLIVKGI